MLNAICKIILLLVRYWFFNIFNAIFESPAYCILCHECRRDRAVRPMNRWFSATSISRERRTHRARQVVEGCTEGWLGLLAHLICVFPCRKWPPAVIRLRSVACCEETRREKERRAIIWMDKHTARTRCKLRNVTRFARKD
jgi:hypothetical protein